MQRIAWIGLPVFVLVMALLMASAMANTSASALPPIAVMAEASRRSEIEATQQQAAGSANKWLVEFSGSSQWDSLTDNTQQQESISIEGSAHVECDASGLNCTAHVSQLADYLRTSSTPSSCGWYRNRYWIGAGQWSIYEDDQNFMLLVIQNPDGSYNMPLPFTLSRWYDVSLLAEGFTYPNCTPYSNLTAAAGQDPWEPLVAHDPGPHVLTLTLPGGYFHVERTYLDNSFNPPARRSYQIRAIPLVNCANAKTTIQDGPGLTHYEIHLDTNSPQIRPDGAATFTTRVTCGGVPVKGAQIDFETQAAPNTGFHAHGEVLGARPNGCINGINIQDESIPEYSDDQGLIYITFQPGTNETCGAPRGIAGRYRLTARRFPWPMRFAACMESN